MWIVRRPFRSRGVHYQAGDVVTSPEPIKLFNSKLSGGKLLEVPATEEELQELQHFFKVKIGVDFTPNLEAAVAKKNAVPKTQSTAPVPKAAPKGAPAAPKVAPTVAPKATPVVPKAAVVNKGK